MRRNPETNMISGYYRLCENYRDAHDNIRNRTILAAGFLDNLSVEQKQSLSKRITDMVKNGEEVLFGEPDGQVEFYARQFYAQIKAKHRLDLPENKNTKPHKGDWQTVDLDSLKNKDVREIGSEWMCMQALQQLAIPDFLENRGWEASQIRLALTHIISRAVYPASELKTTSWIHDNSAVCELTGLKAGTITKDILYSISHRLYKEKDAMEQYLSKKTNDLFDLQDRIILYDLTNTYFEGKKLRSKKAKRGRSKEKRNDAKIVVLAAVVNPEGFLKYTDIFEGNMSDSTSLSLIIDKLRLQTSSTSARCIVVMDAGIATDKNCRMLKAKGYDYICVSRSRLKNYKLDEGEKTITITDKKDQPIELTKVIVDKSTDYYLRVKSYAKQAKENSMKSLFAQRFETGLQQIAASLGKKGGVKRIEKVWERLGRLKAKYPSIHKRFHIDVSYNKQGLATKLTWQVENVQEVNNDSGIYFLRTSLPQKDEATLWTIYNTIREIEYTFRVLKTDLNLRPIFHKNDDASMAHLNLGLLAYWIVTTIRYQLKQKDITSEWRELVRIMNTQKCVTTTVINQDQAVICIRRCSEPIPEVQKVYDALKYKNAPFVKKKSVVLTSELKKNDSPILQRVMDD